MSPDGPIGQIQRSGDNTTLLYRRSLAHSPAKVWSALTESAHMRWWMPVDMVGEREVGATVGMVFWPDLADKNGLDPNAGTAEITVWEPMRTFAWAWHGTTVRFDIEATDQGCDLTLTLDIPTGDPDTIVDNAGGFHLWMDHLTALVNNGSTPPLAAANADHLEPRYRMALGQQ